MTSRPPFQLPLQSFLSLDEQFFSLVTTFNWNSSIKFLYFCLESTWTRIFTLEMWIITKFDILLSQSSKPFAFSLRTLIFSDSSLLSQILEAGFLCLSLLLLYIYIFLLVSQSCPILCDPMDCSPPGSSVHGILQAKIVEWVAIPSSRGSSQPRDQTQVSCITVNSLPFGLSHLLLPKRRFIVARLSCENPLTVW